MPSMPSGLNFEAVVLAGGDDKRMYPLTSTTLKAFLPMANEPLISYSLRMLSDAGLRNVFLVTSGEKAAASMTHWLAQEGSVPPSLTCEVVSTPEDAGTAGALRAVAGRIRSHTVVVLSGDLLTNMPLAHMVAAHQLAGAAATVLLGKRKTSPAADTKPGKPPKNVDYIGLDPDRRHLLFYATSPETLRELKLPLSVARTYGTVEISGALVDAHFYVFNRSVLKLLADHPAMTSLRQDFLPFLAAQQFSLPTRNQPTSLNALSANADPPSSGLSSLVVPGDDEDDEQLGGSRGAGDGSLPGSDYMSMSHCMLGATQLPNSCRVVVVQPGTYCARVAGVQSYAEINKELADSNTALHLTRLKPSKHDNICPPSTTFGHKTTVAAACILGESCVLGDKTSIKRSVLGNSCRLGVNVKVINSVLMDGVVVADGCHIQNSILCSGATVQAGTTLKDCQIGAGYTVAGGVEYKDEVLARPK